MAESISTKLRLAVAFGLVLGALALPTSAAAIVYGITAAAEPRLVAFDPATPSQLVASTKVAGLDAGEVVRGMDLRPVTGGLVLLTTSSGGAARLRTVDPGTGVVSAAIPLTADPTDFTSPYAALSPGTGVGVDFNPVPDRLRVVTSTGQNLRVNAANGLTVTDANLNPGTPEAVAAGYINSFPGATLTTLYDVDLAFNGLAIQNPPNNGTLVTVGALGFTPSSGATTDLDISANGNAAYLVATAAGATRLYSVNLATGAATAIGNVGNGAIGLSGMAVANNVIAPATDTMVTPEGAGAVAVSVTRLSPHLGATVDYATVDGSAVAGKDYDARSGTLLFAAGETAKTILVPLRDDTTVGPARSFSVALSNAQADAGATATLAGPVSTLVAIGDDDTPSQPGSPTLPPPSAPLGADTTKPVLLASASKVNRARLRSKGLKVTFSCSEACTVEGKLLAGKRTAATKSARLARAGTGVVRFKLTKAGRKAIRERKRIKVVLTARDAAGNRASRSLTVRIV